MQLRLDEILNMKARQKDAILRNWDSIPTTNNAEARQLLGLQERDRSKVSRLFANRIL